MKIILALSTLLLFSLAGASDAPGITVNATGTAKVVPTALQVWVTIKEKGPDAAAAVQALKAAQEKLTAKLGVLGVKSEQIHSELPTVVDKSVQEAMRARRTGQRLKRKTNEEKPEVEMQQMVRALVPLSAKDLAGLVVEAEALKAKIKAAKLAEDKAADGGDEDDGNANPFDNQNNTTAAVTFMYFADKSDEVQSQAITDALKKATETASRAAKAMGKAGVEIHAVSIVADSQEQMINQYYQYERYGRVPEMPLPDAGLASQTPQISMSTTMTVEFRLK